MIVLLGAPFILPVIVAVLGLVSVFGRGGPVNGALALAGLGPVSIYGWQGVILAHVFFNLPLATRLILQGWATIPGERLRLAAALDFGPGDVLRHLEWPMLRAVVPGVALVIFLICTTSFAVALALGGGPRATTVELAIYQAFRFDFDLGRAAQLGAVQLAIGGAAALLSLRVALPQGFGAGLDRTVPRWDGGAWLRMQDALAIGLACAFLAVPVVSVLGRGVLHLADLPAPVWWAAARSLAVALTAAILTSAAALAMAFAATARRGGWIEVTGTLAVAASPLVLGAGLYILLLPVTDPVRLALPRHGGGQRGAGPALRASRAAPRDAGAAGRLRPAFRLAGDRRGGLAAAGGAAATAAAAGLRGRADGGAGGGGPRRHRAVLQPRRRDAAPRPLPAHGRLPDGGGAGGGAPPRDPVARPVLGVRAGRARCCASLT